MKFTRQRRASESHDGRPSGGVRWCVLAIARLCLCFEAEDASSVVRCGWTVARRTGWNRVCLGMFASGVGSRGPRSKSSRPRLAGGLLCQVGLRVPLQLQPRGLLFGRGVHRLPNARVGGLLQEMRGAAVKRLPGHSGQLLGEALSTQGHGNAQAHARHGNALV
jgi:hypothetical protein